MDHKEFYTALSKQALPSVLLFEGEEEHLKQDALSSLRRSILPEGLEQLNEILLEDPLSDELIAAAETLPFMSEKRLLIIRDYSALSGRSEADDKIVSYLTSVPVFTVLLFYCTGKPDGRKKIYTTIKKMGGVVSFAPLRGAELTQFVTESFHQLGKECDTRTAEYLVFTVGSDTALLLSEMRKIVSYASDRPAIEASDISSMATPSTECTVFQMVDAVVAGQNSKALRLFRNQLLTGTDRMVILSMLLRQYRLLQHIKIMQYEKKSVDYIRSSLGVPSFAVEQYTRQASSYSGGQVKQAVAACFETEYSVKSGRIQAEGAVETLILKLLTLRSRD